METEKSLQLRTNSSLPSVATEDELAAVRLNERQYPHYCRIPAASRQRWLATEIKALASLARIRDLDAREAIMMAASLDDMLLAEPIMRELTLPELHTSFTNGTYGQYGEFYGLSAPNLYGFVKAFISSPEKKAASDIVFRAKRREMAAKRDKEREDESRRIRAEIEKAKKDGSFVPTGNVWYQPKKVDDAIRESEDAAHRELVRRQAQEILKQNGNGT